MIVKVNVVVEFPLGAEFYHTLDLEVYKKFLRFLKSLTCFSVNEKCSECKQQDSCQYNQLTGRNFTEYPGVFMKIDRFGKNRFFAQEERRFTFYFIGECEKYSDFVELFFHSLRQSLWKNPFYLKQIQKERVDESICSGTTIEVDTVVENDSLHQIIQNTLTSYQVQYGLQSTFSCESLEPDREMKIREEPCFLGTRKVRPVGKIGTYRGEKIELPKFLFETGIGRWNYLGGGKIAIKNTFDEREN
ncbi:hypothetical protein [uncultured Dubosiella sp.]|uniref:hypothetical protein n=1 Tax=uncultured Dubosiella sp. TaxID=1937011 RepID=UPI00272FF289|nr:hypothetical protein [uncultured Dubosiella sp.]